MKVFARYEPGHAGVFRLWFRGWKARGWTPKLVNDRKRIGRPGGLTVSMWDMNFSARKKEAWALRADYGAPGWESAPIVTFPPGTTEDDILKCGRAL
jgi:hypothetical protein